MFYDDQSFEDNSYIKQVCLIYYNWFKNEPFPSERYQKYALVNQNTDIWTGITSCYCFDYLKDRSLDKSGICD